MSFRPIGPGERPAAIALWLMVVAVGVGAIAAANADAAYYKMVACSGNNGAPPHSISTNTASPQNPGGIFHLWNWCDGEGGDPPGEGATIRIQENQAAGNAGNGAYGHFVFDTPAHVHYKAAGGYTRQPAQFNDGWRARFWVASPTATAQVMIQGAGLPNSGGQWATTGSFAPHLWPFGVYWDFTRFVYEMQCVRPSGCDRSGTNATDLNGMVFILSDDSDSQVGFSNTGSALMQGHWVRGTQTVAFSVSDLGSGLRHERLRVDGAERWGRDHWPECNTSSSQLNGEWARAYAPCPTGGPWGRAVTLDTASLADGAHDLQVCTQDYGQYQGLDGTGSESCTSRMIRVDNTAPGTPGGLHVNSDNPARYMDRFGATFSLPSDPGSPIAKVHYEVTDAAGKVVIPEKVVSGTNPTDLAKIEGPKAPGDYRLRVQLEDAVGLVGSAASVPIPRDTTPPAAPQEVSVTAPEMPRSAQGFDVRWRNIVDEGSPIDAVHYQVRSASGAVVVPTTTVAGRNVEAIADLNAPGVRGAHTLLLWLSDEEGNVGAPVSVRLAYSCVRSEEGAGTGLTSVIERGGRERAVVSQGQGAALHGRLSGGDVAGASLCVFSRVVTEAEPRFLGISLTNADGRYRFAVPAGPSRELTVAYRRGHRELTTSAQLATRVKPVFAVRRKVVRNKGVARFVGRIPAPHNDDVVVVLQVKRGDGWLVFRRYRTREGGRFTVGYRFNRTDRPTLYLMRAQVRSQKGYPYLQGTSEPLRLIVLPERR